MNTQSHKTTQTAHEQQAVDGMYLRLESDLNRSLAAQKRALATTADGAGDLFARDVEVSRQTESVKQLRAAEQSLCFGRIDGNFEDDVVSLHIGRMGLRDEDGEIILVDWRAEAARPFYSATYASPLGVRRRRHLKLNGRQVADVSDEILDGTAPLHDDVVGDSPLVMALSGARTGRMQEAAATLQAEQDEIVRSASIGITVVDGGPGTGKTIVALHRAAYVLYGFPAIAKRGVLVYGPNQRFLTYISDVLPSLGENDVQLATAADLVPVTPTRAEADDVARIKGRAEIALGLDRWLQSHGPQHTALTLHTPYETVTLDASVVNAAKRSALQGGIGYNLARELFAENIIDELVIEIERLTAQETQESEEELESDLGSQLDQLAGADGDAEGGMDINWELVRESLMEDASIEEEIADVWPILDAETLLSNLLGDDAALAAVFPELAPHDIALLAGSDHGAGWSDADLPLLDEMFALVDGPPESVFGHIVIDEAQQLTEMHWRMLMRRCPGRSMTVVGDLAQAGPVTTVRTWQGALAPFVQDRFAHHTLTVNYRTTAEILAETQTLLTQIAPDQKLAQSIRHGEAPHTMFVSTETCWTTLSDLITATNAAHPGELIGVVATTVQTAELEADVVEAGAQIVAAPDARGLEFDTVIIVDPEAIQSATEAGLRDLYVAKTRATKRLYTMELAR